MLPSSAWRDEVTEVLRAAATVRLHDDSNDLLIDYDRAATITRVYGRIYLAGE